ncbi:MAG: putative ABC transporter permease, partial [Propionibacteriaceae bacterium]|nr:putative ABC transporter permease [Propionibacteriaceae bacterium]
MDATAPAASAPQRWFLYLMVSAIVGYVYEFLLCTFMYAGFVNQGPLRGPWLMIYGVGGVLVIALLGRLRGRKLRLGRVNLMPAVLFAAIFAISTTVEFFAHWA